MKALERLEGGGEFDSPHGLLRWCYRVSGNLVTDTWRMQSRHLHVGEVEEQREDNVAAIAEWKVALSDAVDAIDRLADTDREALLGLLSGPSPTDKRSRDRESLRRLRARDRLRKMTGGLPVVFPWRRLRWLFAQVDKPAGALVGSFLVAGMLVAQAPYLRGRSEAVIVTVAAQDSSPTPELLLVSLSIPEHDKSDRTPTADRHVIEHAPPPLPPGVVDRENEIIVVNTPTGAETEAGTVANTPESRLICAETE